MDNIIVTLAPPPDLGAYLLYMAAIILFWVLLIFDWLVLFSLVFSASYLLCGIGSRFIPGAPTARVRNHLLLASITASAIIAVFPVDAIVASFGTESVDRLLTDSVLGLLPMVLSIIWAVGMLFLLSLWTWRYFKLFATSYALPDSPDDPALIEAHEIAGMKKSIAVKSAAESSGVVSWGLFKPFILAPTDFIRAFSHDERRFVYLHELLHIKRKDSLARILSVFLKSIFWFNPVMHRAINTMLRHIEMECDRNVLTYANSETLPYAETIGKMATWHSPILDGFANRRHAVHERIENIFSSAPSHLERLGSFIAFLIFAGVVGIAVIPRTITGSPNPNLPSSIPIHNLEGKVIEIPVNNRQVYRGFFGIYSIMAAAQDIERHNESGETDYGVKLNFNNVIYYEDGGYDDSIAE